MVDTIGNPKPQFDLGRVINRTFGAIKNNLLNFFLASFLIMGIPMFVMGIAPLFLGMSGGMIYGNGYVIFTLVTAIVTMAASIIVQGALIFGAIEDFNGRKATWQECFSVALRYFFPLLGLGILVSLGVFLGFILLIIPGVIVWLGWMIAAPVLIVEKKGITDSISRSWELTAGYKRWILLLMVLLIIIAAVIGAVIGILGLAFGDPTTLMVGGASPTYFVVNAIISAFTQSISSMISATGVAAIYYEIRQIKEGIGAENLAAVFD